MQRVFEGISKQRSMSPGKEEPLNLAPPARDSFFRKDSLHATLIDRLPCAGNR